MISKYKFNFEKKISVALWLVVAICLIGIIADIALLAISIKDELPYIPYIVSLVMLVFLAAFIMIIRFGTMYVLEDKKFVTIFALYKTKIDYSDILLIRRDVKTKQTLMYFNAYTKNGEKLVNFRGLNINEQVFDKFIQDLKEKNNMIIYEPFNQEENNGKI